MKTLTSLGVRKTAEIPASASETMYVHILDYSLLYIRDVKSVFSFENWIDNADQGWFSVHFIVVGCHNTSREAFRQVLFRFPLSRHPFSCCLTLVEAI